MNDPEERDEGADIGPDSELTLDDTAVAVFGESEEGSRREGEPAGRGGEVIPYDPLERYLAEIRNVSPLSREEEHELAVRYLEQGDRLAGYRLVLANLKLVVMIAREYQRNVQNILDLVQEGNIGLLEAVKQYDPYRGIRFPSYAVYWIRAYILRYLISNLRLVKIGTTQAQRKLFFNLQKEKEKLEAEGFIPEAKLLAERLQVKEAEVIEMEQRLALPDLSVDAPLSSGGEESTTLHSFLADARENVEEHVVAEQFRASLRGVVERFREQLDEKERAIIDDRLMTDEPVTLQVIADRFNLSRERIRQIENQLKARLRPVLREELQLDREGDVSIEGKDDGIAVPALVVIFVIVCAVLWWGISEWRRLERDPQYASYLHFFETSPPEVTFPVRLSGIGLDPGTLRIAVVDEGAGIDEVVVRCEQDGERKEILRRSFNERRTRETFDVTISGKELRLISGGASVEVSVFDRAFWSNGSKAHFDFLVDYDRPKVSVVSVQHNALVGGSEIVFYQLEKEEGSHSGVGIGQHIFPGVPASKFDPAFTSVSRLYASYIAFPHSFDEARDIVHAFGDDEVGNRGTASFYYRAQSSHPAERKRVVAREIVEHVFGELHGRYRSDGGTKSLPATLPEQFRFFDEDYRAETEARLVPFWSRTAVEHYAQRFPIGPFLRQQGGMNVDYGERQRFFIVNDELGVSWQRGADFLAPDGSPVVAAEAGKVTWAGDLGVYGKAVVIDHGLGIATLYGSLSDTSVAADREVKQGEAIGLAGRTGLVFDSRVRFEVRVHGVPVRPIEWWDRRWLHDHFALKLTEVKKILGIGEEVKSQ